MSRVLGLSAYHADASAAAVVDGRFVAGVEEERFRRIKHWAGFPERAVRFCLGEMETDLSGVSALAVARQPRAYLGRKAWLALTHPRSLRRALGRARQSPAGGLPGGADRGGLQRPGSQAPSGASTTWPTWPPLSTVRRSRKPCASRWTASAISSRP